MIETIEEVLNIKDTKKLIAGHNHVHNDLFTGFYKDQEVVIRVTKNNRKNQALVRGEVDFLRKLNSFNLDIIRPIEIGGQYVHLLKIDHHEHVALVFEKIYGHGCFEIEHSDQHIISAATSLAKIHIISRESGPYNRPTWDKNPYFEDIKASLDGLKCHEKIYDGFLALKKRLSRQSKTLENYGLVHGDFFYGNMIYQENGLTIIDFDECEYNWYWYDIIVYFFYYLLGGYPKNIDYKENNRKFLLFINTYKAHNNLPMERQEFYDDLTLLRGFKLYISCKKILKHNYGHWQSDYVELFESAILRSKPIFQWDQIMC